MMRFIETRTGLAAVRLPVCRSPVQYGMNTLKFEYTLSTAGYIFPDSYAMMAG